MYEKLLNILSLNSNKIKSQIFEECFIRKLTKDETEKVYRYYENNYNLDCNISDTVEIIILKLNLTTP